MKLRRPATIAACLLTMAILPVLLCLAEKGPGIPSPVPAAPRQIAPTVALVDPSSAPNDLDTRIVITGTDFVATPTVHLGNTLLDDVEWLSATVLIAAVPWGMDPAVYTLTVSNPGGESGSLANAFTATQGIGVWNAGELYGGSVEAVVVNPITPTTVYAASNHVGLFRSRDGGESWSFQFAGSAVMHPVIDPHAPNRLYMHGPWTLYRSDDAGDTWTALDPQFPFTETAAARCTPFFIRPYVHPLSDTVYAIACGNGHGDQSGLLRSSDHGGTWESITTGITDTQITALACDPQGAQTMYVGTGSGHVFVSSNGGITWTHAAKPVECVGALAVNPFGSHELWVASNDSFGDPCVLRRSADAGLTEWTTLTETQGCSWPGASIEFASGISGTVFVAGFGGSGLETTDGGSTWTVLSPSGDAAVQSLALHPTQTDTIYLGDKWAGVYKTMDGGETWPLANKGLTALYPEQMDVHPGRPDVVYARLNSEELYRGTQGGAVWQRLPLSRIASVRIDPAAPARIYAGGSGGSAYVYVSEDDGQTWVPSSPLPKSAEYDECWSFPWLLLALPEQPGTLLVGAQHHCDPLPHPANLYRTTDGGDNWQQVYTYTYHAYGPFGDLACDVVTPTICYAALPNGEDGLLRSTDSGQSWERAGEGEAGMEFARSIAVEPVSPYRVFVMTGSPSPLLYLSENHGLTWTQVISPPDPSNVNQILFTGAQPAVLYAAGRIQGLFRLRDQVEPWEWGRAAGVLGFVPVYSLAAVTDTGRVILYAGTTGGYVEDGGAQAPRLVNDDGLLVNAGVYRYTQRTWRAYLPLLSRARLP